MRLVTGAPVLSTSVMEKGSPTFAVRTDPAGAAAEDAPAAAVVVDDVLGVLLLQAVTSASRATGMTSVRGFMFQALRAILWGTCEQILPTVVNGQVEVPLVAH